MTVTKEELVALVDGYEKDFVKRNNSHDFVLKKAAIRRQNLNQLKEREASAHRTYAVAIAKKVFYSK